MDTFVTAEVVTARPATDAAQAIDRAFGWFREVESRCSRFDPGSELMQVCQQPGTPAAVSPLLYRALEFALAVAEATGGAFDPTVGAAMRSRGFDQHYRTGQRLHAPLATMGVPADYRSVVLDPAGQTLTLKRPLVLDLGAVAKGFAIDLAAAELGEYDSFVIEAGGDIFARGTNGAGQPWQVGIRHPRDLDVVIDTLAISDAAVCTSGDYERRIDGDDAAGHILDPRTGAAADGLASVNVVAPTAMLADAMATAAFVLGPAEGRRLLEREGIDALFITPSLERLETRAFARYRR